MEVEVTVDADLCIGSGDCERLVPSAFHLDEDLGVAIPRETAATADLVAILRAAQGCPTQAIRVVRDAEVLHESN